MDFVAQYIAPIGTVIAVALSVWNLIQSPSKQNASDLADFKRDEHGPLKDRVSAVETRIENVPSKDTVHQLDKKVTELNGTINVVAESLKAVERTAHRIENFLLDQAKK